MPRIGRSEVRVAANVLIGQHVMPERKTVLHAEPVAPVVTVSTVLRRSTLWVDGTGVRTYSKVAAAELMLLPRKV